MNIYCIRIILDTEEDIFRDIEIDRDSTLGDLHRMIVECFSFDEKEMASFYKSDIDWQQGEEIPLIAMDEDISSMQDLSIKEVLQTKKDRLIYIYDYLQLWTFFVVLVNIIPSEEERSYPFLLFSKGERPDTPLEKKFEADSSAENEEDIFSDDNPEEEYYDDENYY